MNRVRSLTEPSNAKKVEGNLARVDDSSSISSAHNSNLIIKNYVITSKRLGRGSSAVVYLGYHNKKKIKVAVKKFELPPNNPRVKRRAHREMEILQRIQHPNIVRLYDVYFDDKNNIIYLFLEYCPYGSMKSFLGKGGFMEEIYVKKIMKQLSNALHYLFRQGIYHRDIKPHNLLLSKNYNLKISDFGLATMNKRGTFKRLCGSPLYMAPEILLSSTYNKRSDLWSIGIVLFEFLFGYHPFRKMRKISDLVELVKQDIMIKIPPDKKPDNANPSVECINLLYKLLQSDPQKRISWEDFFHHPWLNTQFILSHQILTIYNGKINKINKIITDESKREEFLSSSEICNIDDHRFDNKFDENTYDSIGRESIFNPNKEDKSTYKSFHQSMNSDGNIELKKDNELRELTQLDQNSDEINGPDNQQIDMRFAKISPIVYSHKSLLRTVSRKLSDRDKNREAVPNKELAAPNKEIAPRNKKEVVKPNKEIAPRNKKEAVKPNKEIAPRNKKEVVSKNTKNTKNMKNMKDTKKKNKKVKKDKKKRSESQHKKNAKKK